MSAKAKKPTLQDVSDCTGGVHRNTISKILKGTYEGDAETIKSVKDAATRLGYSIEKSAHNTLESDAPVDDADLPEGVRLFVPDEKLTRHHNWSIEFFIEVECEWEYDKDDHNQPAEGTAVCVATEKRRFEQCLPERPSLREVQLLIEEKRSTLPDAV